MRSFRKCAAFIGLAIAAAGVGCAVGAGGEGGAAGIRVESAERLPQWETPFKKADPRWRGADANISVDLGAARILWLFGDSWITNPDARGREGGHFARNSLAIQPGAMEGSGKPVFFWKSDAKGEPTGAFTPDDPTQWHWPLSGIRLDGGLVVFLTRLKTSGDDPVFNFAGTGNEMAVVANPEAAPEKWDVRRGEIPYFTHSKTGDRCFGLACVRDLAAEGARASGDFVYIYGIRENWARGFGGRGIIVARSYGADLLKLNAGGWEFFDGKEWNRDVEAAAELFDGAAAEMSVSWLPGPKKFVAVYTSMGLSDEVVARFADRPEGPWSKPLTLFRTPEMKEHKQYMTYAGKAHPELASGPWELIVTYAVNSRDFGDHFKDADLYWPMFYRVKLGD